MADIRKDHFAPDEIAIANHLGIGLIQIKGKECTEILTSPYYKPLTSLHLLLLEKLALGRCQLCGCFFETGSKGKQFSKLSRDNIKGAVDNKKGLMFWNYPVGKRKLKMRRHQPKGDYIYERRFICPECIIHLDTWVDTLSRKDK